MLVVRVIIGLMLIKNMDQIIMMKLWKKLEEKLKIQIHYNVL